MRGDTNRAKKRSPLKLRPLRLPGQSVQEEMDRLMDDKMLFWMVAAFLAAFAAAWEWWRWYSKAPYHPIAFSILALVVIPVAVFRIASLRKKLRALKLGRDGERIVAENLRTLRRNGAIVLHDLQGPDFNVDHVVLSRQGIYAIGTKTYSKRPGAQVRFDGTELTVDGRRPDRDPIVQVRAAARWVQDRLRELTGKKLPVRPVLVFPGWFVNPVEEQGGSDVWVLHPKALPEFIQHEPVSLSEEDFRLAVFQLATVARTA